MGWRCPDCVLKNSYSLSTGALQSDFVFSEFKILQNSREFAVRSFVSLFISCS